MKMQNKKQQKIPLLYSAVSPIIPLTSFPSRSPSDSHPCRQRLFLLTLSSSPIPLLTQQLIMPLQPRRPSRLVIMMLMMTLLNLLIVRGCLPLWCGKSRGFSVLQIPSKFKSLEWLIFVSRFTEFIRCFYFVVRVGLFTFRCLFDFFGI